MLIFYRSDNEPNTVFELDDLFANFRDSETKHCEEDIRDELDGRGWYEGLHEDGRYIILNLDRLELTVKPASRLSQETDRNAVFHEMRSLGFEVHHTGGGCMAWRKPVGNGWFWTICDEGNGLGDRPDEPYHAGLYHRDGAFIDADELLPSLDDAIAWCRDVTVPEQTGMTVQPRD
jgi:hypothetical protein